MKNASFGSQYSGEAIVHAVYLYNVTATANLNMITCHEKLFGTVTPIENVRVFGCVAYAYKHVRQRLNKFDARAEKGMYMGNRDYMHRIYISESKKLVITKHAALNEDEFTLLRRQTAGVFVDGGTQIIAWTTICLK